MVKKEKTGVQAKKKRKIEEGGGERKSSPLPPHPQTRDNLVHFAFALLRNFFGPKQVLGNTNFQGHRYVFYCLVTFAKLGLEMSG
jgi:hypothetical protein